MPILDTISQSIIPIHKMSGPSPVELKILFHAGAMNHSDDEQGKYPAVLISRNLYNLTVSEMKTDNWDAKEKEPFLGVLACQSTPGVYPVEHIQMMSWKWNFPVRSYLTNKALENKDVMTCFEKLMDESAVMFTNAQGDMISVEYTGESQQISSFMVLGKKYWLTCPNTFTCKLKISKWVKNLHLLDEDDDPMIVQSEVETDQMNKRVILAALYTMYMNGYSADVSDVSI